MKKCVENREEKVRKNCEIVGECWANLTQASLSLFVFGIVCKSLSAFDVQSVLSVE